MRGSTLNAESNLADRIRAALAPAHDAVEKTDFATAMAAGRLDRWGYAAVLPPLHGLHGALEARLALPSVAEWVGSVYRPETMARTLLVAADLSVLGTPPSNSVAAAAVERLAEDFAHWSAARPWALLGPLYVVEGSRMGSMILARRLAETFGVRPEPGVGLDYHVVGLATRPAEWQRFKAALNAITFDRSQQDEIVAAASTTMDGLVEIYGALPGANLESAHA